MGVGTKNTFFKNRKFIALVLCNNVKFVNRDAIRFARKTYPEVSNKVKKELAEFLEVSDEEIVITRNATEALNIAIQGYPFRQGDEVVVNQLDYFSMVETFEMLEKRGEVKIVSFEMPLVPSTEEEIVEIYRSLINKNTRVLLLTHVSNINGLIVPVTKISAMARSHGVDVICDSAHALGQVKYSLSELGVDFVGMNLHKWIGNPIGAGVLYVRKNRVQELKSLFGDVGNSDSNINKLSHFGTTPFAVIMTIPDSLAFHKLMDIEKISARLHYLKNRWLSALKDHPGVEIVTPIDNVLSCAIASFRVPQRKSIEIANELMQKFNILTTSRVLGANGCIRVTPSLFTPASDVDKFVQAVKAIV